MLLLESRPHIGSVDSTGTSPHAISCTSAVPRTSTLARLNDTSLCCLLPSSSDAQGGGLSGSERKAVLEGKEPGREHGVARLCS